MKESVAIAKEADAKKDFLPTKSDNSIHRARNEPDRQLGSLRSVIDNIRRNGGIPSVDSIATELSGMHTAQRVPVLLALQHTHGNRYVQRVVAGIQAKLKVGQPGDIYEQEAERVADQVMRMPETRVQRHFGMEEERKKKKEEGLIMAKGFSGKAPEVSDDLYARLNSSRDSGQPLPETVRAFFEPRFGYDFNQVRVHTNAQANDSARGLNALAFTVGHDVVFGAGQYSPETTTGKRLLAHELTHVVQQSKTQTETFKQHHIHMVLQREATSNPLPREVQEFLDRVRRHPNRHERLLLTIAFHPNPFQAFFDSLAGIYPFTQQAIQQSPNPEAVVQEAVQELGRIGQDYQRQNPSFGRRIQMESQLRIAVEQAINQLSLRQLEPYLIDALLVSDERHLWGVGLNLAQNELPPQLARQAFESGAAESLYAALGESLRHLAEQRLRTDDAFRRRVEEERIRRQQRRRERRMAPGALQIIWGEEVPT